MEKIDTKTLLTQHGLNWYGLYKRGQGSFSKSMCHDWVIGRHQPTRKSAVKIARVLGLPTQHVLDVLQTREMHENRPKRKLFCVTCHRRLWTIPASDSAYYEQEQTL